MHAGCNFERINIRRIHQDKLGKSVVSKDRAGHTEDGSHRMMGMRNGKATKDVCDNEVRPTEPPLADLGLWLPVLCPLPVSSPQSQREDT